MVGEKKRVCHPSLEGAFCSVDPRQTCRRRDAAGLATLPRHVRVCVFGRYMYIHTARCICVVHSSLKLDWCGRLEQQRHERATHSSPARRCLSSLIIVLLRPPPSNAHHPLDPKSYTHTCPHTHVSSHLQLSHNCCKSCLVPPHLLPPLPPATYRRTLLSSSP